MPPPPPSQRTTRTTCRRRAASDLVGVVERPRPAPRNRGSAASSASSPPANAKAVRTRSARPLREPRRSRVTSFTSSRPRGPRRTPSSALDACELGGEPVRHPHERGARRGAPHGRDVPRRRLDAGTSSARARPGPSTACRTCRWRGSPRARRRTGSSRAEARTSRLSVSRGRGLRIWARDVPRALGVLHRIRVHGGDVEPARLDDVLERVRVDGAGVVRHGGGLRSRDTETAHTPAVPRARTSPRMHDPHHAVDGDPRVCGGHRARREASRGEGRTGCARDWQGVRCCLRFPAHSHPARKSRKALARAFLTWCFYPSRRAPPPPGHFSPRTAARCRSTQISLEVTASSTHARSACAGTGPVGPVGLAAANRLFASERRRRSARAKRVPGRSRDTCATRWRWP